jgi:hypothetical protein
MIFRTTKAQQDEYFNLAQFNFSFGKKFMEHLDPSDNVIASFKGEEPNYFRKGKAVDHILTSTEAFNESFFVMPGNIPSDKVSPILIAVMEKLESNDSYIGDMDEHANDIVSACLPGAVTEEGYGGSWADERKWKALNTPANSDYWNALKGGKGKTKLSQKEYDIAKDAADRIKKTFPAIFDGRYKESKDVHVYFQHICRDVPMRTYYRDLKSVGKTTEITCKGMQDIVIVNESGIGIEITKGFSLPAHSFIVIDLKTSAQHISTWKTFLFRRAVDVQTTFYADLFKAHHRLNLKAMAGMMFVSLTPQSIPFLIVIDDAYMLEAREGKIIFGDYKGEIPGAEDRDIEILQRTGSIKHGYCSYLQKYAMHKDAGIMDRELQIHCNENTLILSQTNGNVTNNVTAGSTETIYSEEEF